MDQKCQVQDNAALETGQKGLSDGTEMTKDWSAMASLSDYDELSYILRSNFWQGGPLKIQSVTKTSFTPDIFERRIIDRKHWHGRTITELGRWTEKYFLDLNTARAMKEKYS